MKTFVVAALAFFAAIPGLAQNRPGDLPAHLGQRWHSERAEAETLASRKHFPVRIDRNGVSAELQRLNNGMPQYVTTENLNAAKTISTDRVWAGAGFGYALSGTGITLGEWDAGLVRTTHQEFGGRVAASQGTLNFHSTHVAGTLVAAGVSATRKGMSYNGNLNAYDWNNDASEMSSQANAGMRVSNHSYAIIGGWYYNYFNDSKWAWFGDVTVSSVEDYNFGFYSAEAQQWDQIANTYPYYLIFKAAGNDRNEGPGGTIQHWVFSGGNWNLQTAFRNQDGNSGFDCIMGAGNSKNIMTVGAVNDITTGYVNAAGVVMSSFSCWGPTDDGRIKPDIVANGVSLSSTLETADNAYGSLSGTSMASPNAAGSAGLLLELYKNMHGNTLIRSSTMKGLIIHTADEAGTNPGPDYSFGWGLINTLKAAQLMTQDSIDGYGFHIQEIQMHNHDTVLIPIGSDGSVPLRATICWNDPAGGIVPVQLDPTAIELVNDLDLRIIKGNNQAVYSPWILNPASPTSAATTGDNIRDNVEQVYIASPEQANYTLRITHKGTLSLPQYVSVIVSGNVTLQHGPIILVTPDSASYSLLPGAMKTDSLLITNNGDTTLSYQVTIPPADTQWLSAMSPLSDTLGATGSRHFVYRIDATLFSQWSNHSSPLSMTSNDASHSPAAFNIHEHTLGSKIVAHPLSYDISVDTLSSETDTLVIRNDGSYPLHFVISDTGGSFPPWLSLSTDTGTIGGLDSAYIALTLNNPLQAKGTYGTELSIASNDSLTGTPLVHIALHVGTRMYAPTLIRNQWNLLSVPVYAFSYLKTQMFPTSVSSAFVFGQGGYAVKDTLYPGAGFWIKFDSVQTVAIDGYIIPSETVAVVHGWNLIGSITSSIAPFSITSNPGGIVTSEFFGYEGSYIPTDTLRPGKGYWVNVDQDGQLILSSGGAASPATAIRIRPTHEAPPSPPQERNERPDLPAAYYLEQNYPNPFNPITVIRYQIPAQGDVPVVLKIYNVFGQEIAALVNEIEGPGFKSASWDAATSPSGVYFYRLQAGSFSDIKKMILIR
ncbi:MAG TPA: S8 family serine peptidase [Bacteroidota bacterium]|nr:S8 family serine peptidase [Bacteroidota bacterium]